MKDSQEPYNLEDEFETLSVNERSTAAQEESLTKPKNNNIKKSKSTEKGGINRASVKERTKVLGKIPEQSILTLLRLTFHITLASPEFGSTLQVIKQSFYKRSYLTIFTDPSNLPVYAAAYTPCRALCYHNILKSTPQLIVLLSKKSRILAVGSGNGAELVAVSSALLYASSAEQQITLVMRDIGEWGSILQALEDQTRVLWKIPEDVFNCEFGKGDIMEEDNDISDEVSRADLVMFMFVVNELFVDKVNAISIIARVVQNMRKGSYLLVVDSAGSFSHIKIGEKIYMIYFLLDAIKGLERVVAEDSTWYRHPENLKYPVDIQNMRHFIRLYKKN